MKRAILALLLLAFTAPVTATPPPPPAQHTWSRQAWICPGRQRSSIEVEMLSEYKSGYRLRVTELRIDGRRIDPSSVAGLADILARRKFIRIAGGYCDTRGETIGLEELDGGKAPQWQNLSIRYRR